MEEGAAVTKVEAEADGRRGGGKVKARETARQEYQDASSTAIMAEEVKADIVELRVGRLGAGAQCKVRLIFF